MMNLHRVLFITTMAVLLTTGVHSIALAEPSATVSADDKKIGIEVVPTDTTTFVSYCADHFDVCRDKVVQVNNFERMQQLGGKHGCSFPRPGGSSRTNNNAATKGIIEWLSANGPSRAAETSGAIAQAIATLWPNECRN
jgi:hypothetical protein